MAAVGVGAEDFYGKARDILGSAYYTEDFLPYLDTSDKGTSNLYYSWLDERVIAEAIAEENVSRCVPYLNGQGELCFGGWMYIDILWVDEAHRRRGLATACAAGLILACLDRGLFPSWDAANPESVGLAQKLGYRFSHEYPVWTIEL